MGLSVEIVADGGHLGVQTRFMGFGWQLKPPRQLPNAFLCLQARPALGGFETCGVFGDATKTEKSPLQGKLCALLNS